MLYGRMRLDGMLPVKMRLVREAVSYCFPGWSHLRRRVGRRKQAGAAIRSGEPGRAGASVRNSLTYTCFLQRGFIGCYENRNVLRLSNRRGLYS